MTIIKKILFINPSKWGRGVTPIWIASHSSLLKKNNHICELFDCTFYKGWTDYEIIINTKNKQFQETDYLKKVEYKENVYQELKKKLKNFILI